MYRSFTDRVLGGICGGLGALLPINPWIFRLLFLILSIITWGAFAALYLVLWMMIPQQNLLMRQRGGAGMLLIAMILTVVTAVGWVVWAGGGLRGLGGEPLYWAGVALVLAGVYFLRQVRG